MEGLPPLFCLCLVWQRKNVAGRKHMMCFSSNLFPQQFHSYLNVGEEMQGNSEWEMEESWSRCMEAIGKENLSCKWGYSQVKGTAGFANQLPSKCWKAFPNYRALLLPSRKWKETFILFICMRQETMVLKWHSRRFWAAAIFSHVPANPGCAVKVDLKLSQTSLLLPKTRQGMQ